MDNFEDNLSFSLIGTDPKAFYYNGSLEVLV